MGVIDMLDNKQNEENDSLMLFKLITGELIIGSLDHNLMEITKSSDILYIKNPVSITVYNGTLYLTKYNVFSKLNTVMLTSNSVIYVDVPDDDIISFYKEALDPNTSSKLMMTKNKKSRVLH